MTLSRRMALAYLTGHITLDELLTWIDRDPDKLEAVEDDAFGFLKLLMWTLQSFNDGTAEGGREAGEKYFNSMLKLYLKWGTE